MLLLLFIHQCCCGDGGVRGGILCFAFMLFCCCLWWCNFCFVRVVFLRFSHTSDIAAVNVLLIHLLLLLQLLLLLWLKNNPKWTLHCTSLLPYKRRLLLAISELVHQLGPKKLLRYNRHYVIYISDFAISDTFLVTQRSFFGRDQKFASQYPAPRQLYPTLLYPASTVNRR